MIRYIYQVIPIKILNKHKTRPEGLEPSTFGFGNQRSTN